MGTRAESKTRWECDNCGISHEASGTAVRPPGSWIRVSFEEIGTACLTQPLGAVGPIGARPIYRPQSHLGLPASRLYCGGSCLERALEKLDELPQDWSSFAAKAEAKAGGHVLVGSTIGGEYPSRFSLLCRMENPPGILRITPDGQPAWLVTCEKCRSAAGWLPLEPDSSDAQP